MKQEKGAGMYHLTSSFIVHRFGRAASGWMPLFQAKEERLMDWRNRIGLYGAYFLGMCGIGFTLPYLPLYLNQEGLSERTIGLMSTLAALASVAQFPLGLWSDKLNRRKPFLVAGLAVLAASTFLLYHAHGLIWVGFLVILFAENGICRSTVESLAGAEATQLSSSHVGAALGALRFWRPIGIILVALAGGILAESFGVGLILLPLGLLQCLAVLAALLIHEEPKKDDRSVQVVAVYPREENGLSAMPKEGKGLRDAVLWIFVAAMVLFHFANAPGGVYLGLFMKHELGSADGYLSYAFVVSMIAWMIVVRPAGWLSDRLGRKPLLLIGWGATTLRLLLVSVAQTPWQVLVIQVLDGVAQGLFTVTAAAWMTDRLGDPRRAGEAQVLVGTSLVFGSAVGPLVSCLIVDDLGYRGMFGLLAGVCAAATAIILFFVPETIKTHPKEAESESAAASLSRRLAEEA
jgi:MFS family permease